MPQWLRRVNDGLWKLHQKARCCRLELERSYLRLHKLTNEHDGRVEVCYMTEHSRFYKWKGCRLCRARNFRKGSLDAAHRRIYNLHLRIDLHYRAIERRLARVRADEACLGIGDLRDESEGEGEGEGEGEHEDEGEGEGKKLSRRPRVVGGEAAAAARDAARRQGVALPPRRADSWLVSWHDAEMWTTEAELTIRCRGELTLQAGSSSSADSHPG